MKKIFFALICVFFASPFYLSAQVPEEVSGVIETNVIPSVPRPNQVVFIEIESYTYDLSRSKISWYINDALRLSGVGEKKFSFTTGAVGLQQNVRYEITTPQGTSLSKTITINPGDVEFVVEGQGYTPPFYKGKSTYSYEGTARVVALPNLLRTNGTQYNPSELIYTWKKGSATITNASGYGKNVFFYTPDIISRPTTIELTVTNIENTVKARNSITLSPTQGELLVYENSPSLGVLFNKEVGSRFNLIGSEVNLVVAPFGFSDPLQQGLFTWFVNNKEIFEKTNTVSFRNDASEKGVSKISLQFAHQSKFLQAGDKTFDIYFGNNENSIVDTIFNTLF